MKNSAESLANVLGRTSYLDDIRVPSETLEAAVRLSGSARGRILSIDETAAKALDPSVRVIKAADIPGTNQIGSNKSDEELLPESEWEYWGQPLVLVLAATRALARRAAAALLIQTQDLPSRTDAREAAAAGDFILPSRTIAWGEGVSAFARCAFVVSGRVDSGGQEHLYLETQGAFAERKDSGSIFVLSSTQGPSGVQKAVASVLGLPLNKVEVEARRLGGAFGGKEDQAAPWAALAALGAWVSGKPVRLYLDRRDDMIATGKRHPYTSDFRIGSDAEGRLLAFEAEYYQNSGCTCDLSPAILSRTLLHATGAYRIPNVKVTGYMCRTNLPSFTAFRGFGAPQAFFVIESALDALSRKLGKPREELQRINLFSEGDRTHFGMELKDCRAGEAYDLLEEQCGWEAERNSIDEFNAANRLIKRGAAILPICFGISFTKLPMNRAGALVHVYTDGSVLVSTGAVEMGQQVSRKIARAAAQSLGVPMDLVRVERTSTLTVANTVPTAASTGADLNGMAAKLACDEISSRLGRKAAQILGVEPERVSISDGRVRIDGTPSGLDWAHLVQAADEARIDLSAHGFYATPGLVYDAKAERGKPFAYHVYGAARVVAELDLVLGRAKLISCVIAHDSGKSLDPEVDLGQIEGALAQGLGWTLLEDLRFGADGKPLTDTLSTYKVPDAEFLPEDTRVFILPPKENPDAPFNSKAVGEPPLQYGIAAYFAVLQAIRAARRDARYESAAQSAPKTGVFYSIPLIPEKIEAALSGVLPC